MTFDAVPPGQQPTSITPNANSLGSENAHDNKKANRGITVNCARQPIRISFGRLSTILKSCGESVSPMPNMIKPSIGLMAHVSIQTNDAGTISDKAATNSTIRPIHFAIKSQTFFMCTGEMIMVS